jgi:putative CocE/NonD family hydrolase
MRTPYNKKLLREYGEYYSRKGYVVAIQDVRGKYASEGEWQPYKFEGQDGYDAIEWLAEQPWSNAKIGMVGGSYSGSAQLAAAMENPPHLITIIPNITPATPFNNTPYENGAFALGWSIRWSGIVNEDISRNEMNNKYQEAFERNWYMDLMHLPVIDLDSIIHGEKIDFWREWTINEPDDSNYEVQDFIGNIEKIKIPVFLQSGCFDVANRGTKLLYEGLRKSGNKNIKLLIGPWVHSDRSSKQLGQMYLGEDAGIDLFKIYTEWFDYWLKEKDTGILNNPVQIFNIGPNHWELAKEYPSNKAIETSIYLSKDSDDKYSEKKGRLVFSEKKRVSGTKSFTYDPSDPAPSFSEMMKKNKIQVYKRVINLRNDVIVFETGRLEDSLTVAGPIKAILYGASSALDTDFCLTLTGVNKEGNIFPIGQTFGIIRAKYRNSHTQEELLQTGKIYRFEVDLSHTYYTILPGEQLRLEITSSSFPDFSRNLNTGKNNQTTSTYVVAEQQIYFTDQYPSQLVFWEKN